VHDYDAAREAKLLLDIDADIATLDRQDERQLRDELIRSLVDDVGHLYRQSPALAQFKMFGDPMNTKILPVMMEWTRSGASLPGSDSAHSTSNRPPACRSCSRSSSERSRCADSIWLIKPNRCRFQAPLSTEAKLYVECAIGDLADGCADIDEGFVDLTFDDFRDMDALELTKRVMPVQVAVCCVFTQRRSSTMSTERGTR